MFVGALARGDAAILLRFPHKGYREKIWDHAAGVVIVQEAGAVITDASGKLQPQLAHLFFMVLCLHQPWCLRGPKHTSNFILFWSGFSVLGN